MSRIYICSFDEKKPLSYYHDWRDAFERNGFDILNLNANFVRGISRLCKRYEIIVIGYSMYYRLGRKRRVPLVMLLRANPGTKICFMENEYRFLRDKVAFANSCGVDYITTQLPLDSARKIYGDIAKAEVISLPHALNPNVFKPEVSHYSRTVDVGTRSAEYPWYLGDNDRNRALKFIQILKDRYSFNLDVSSDINKRLTREEWAAFLNNAKCTIATEAGTSFLEKDDHSRDLVLAFLKENPNADFETVYNRFFKEYKNPLSGKCISPRDFDAIGTKTCQILLEGRYNDILQPGKHYVELKKDFSNLDEVVEIIQDDAKRKLIVDTAYDFVMENHTHDHRVKDLLRRVA